MKKILLTALFSTTISLAFAKNENPFMAKPIIFVFIMTVLIIIIALHPGLPIGRKLKRKRIINVVSEKNVFQKFEEYLKDKDKEIISRIEVGQFRSKEVLLDFCERENENNAGDLPKSLIFYQAILSSKDTSHCLQEEYLYLSQENGKFFIGRGMPMGFSLDYSQPDILNAQISFSGNGETKEDYHASYP